MLTQKIRFPKFVITSTVFALLVSMASVGKAQDETASAHKSEPVNQIVLVMPNFADISDSGVARLRDDLEEQRYSIHLTLLSQLRDGHLSPFARTEALSLLASFSPNNEETIVTLIQNINVISTPRPSSTNFAADDRFIGFIARRLLARIGIPAEKKILEIIDTQVPDNIELEANPDLSSYYFDSSKTQGFADVLTQIEGKQWALLRLQDGQTNAKNPAIKVQFQAVIDVVKKGAAPVPRTQY